jgi:hypothetical protein
MSGQTTDLQLERMDEQDRHAQAVLDAMRAPFRDLSPEELERETEKAIAEVRAERRAKREREERFAVVERMRESFGDVPPDELEQQVVSLIREMRVEDEMQRQGEERTIADR